jgi:hypothetical protein
VETALRSGIHRRVELVVRESPAPDASLDALGPMLQDRLSAFDGIAGVYVLDLDTGRELALNADVAFSGMGLLKLAVLVATYDSLDTTPDDVLRQWLGDMLTTSDDGGTAAANTLLDWLGGGDGMVGAERVTTVMNALGLVNTFIALPFSGEAQGGPPSILTPANSRTDIQTQADPLRQTTPADMGQLLQMIYQCARGGGTLLAALPERFTPDECRAMLETLSTVQSGNLFETAIPAEASLAHRPAWGADTHADAGIVFSPGGDYVFAVFVWRAEYLDWGVSSPLVTDLTKATYSFFNR